MCGLITARRRAREAGPGLGTYPLEVGVVSAGYAEDNFPAAACRDGHWRGGASLAVVS